MAAKNTEEKKKPFHEQVADKLIEQLKAGVAPWQKPWDPGTPGAGMPVNATTGKRYRGVNAVQLLAQGHDDPRWATYRQAEAVGAQVRRGEHGTPIQYWKYTEEQIKRDESGKPVKDAEGNPVKEEVRLERPRMFCSTVFNASQIDGLPPLQPRKEHEWSAVERAEKIMEASGATIKHAEQDRAFYRPGTDSIHLPNKEQFPTADAYYATALHELGHWTGSAERLDRDLSHPFGSAGYAKEELRAEIASMIVGDTLGIGHDPKQHASYVGYWIESLQNDPLEIVRAAGDAEKIHDYVLAFEQKQVQEQTATTEQTQTAAVQQAQEIVIATDSGNYYTGAEIEPWTDDAREAQVYTRDDAPAALIEVTAEQAAFLEDSALRLEVRDPENPRITLPYQPEAQRPEAVAPAAPPLPPSEPVAVKDAQDIVLAIHGDTYYTGATIEPWTDDARDARVYPTAADAQAVAAELQVKQAQVLGDTAVELRVRDPDQPQVTVPFTSSIPEPTMEPTPRDPEQPAATAQVSEAPAVQEDQQGRGDKTYINVPYKQKEEAKALGAKWDRGQQSWYVPPGVDLEKFSAWSQVQQPTAAPAVTPTVEPGPAHADQAPAQPPVSIPRKEREYLAVPYEERGAAKEAGAQWDKAAKSWYVGPNADTAKLERWNLDKVAAQQGPAMTPREEFADALRSIGCVVTGAHPIMDGTKHRITVEGEKHSEKAGAGFYVGHADGHPAGYMKNNRTGAEMKWKSKGYAIDPEQKAALAAESTAKLQVRAAEQAELHERTAQRVTSRMESLVPVTSPTPYMEAKGLAPMPGVFTDRAGKETFIPAIDVNGKQWSVQYVQEDGTKRFAKDSRKEGCFNVVGGDGLAELEKAPALVIGEGYGTANTLSQSLGYATVAAFDSGNLPAVATALHQRFPDKPVIIAGDDDRHLEATLKVNPGKKKAEEAAKAVGGKVVLPIFAPGELDRDPKGFTDFNDLANKSVLGKDGVERQVRAVVDDAIERHHAQRTEAQQVQQQERAQQRERQPRRSAKM